MPPFRLHTYFLNAANRHHLTGDMVEGLLNNGTGHALLRHGPGADLAARFADNPNFNSMATKFCFEKDMIVSTTEAVKSNPLGLWNPSSAGPGITRLKFEYSPYLSGLSVPVAYLNRAGAAGVMEEHAGIVRTIVELRPGLLPEIVTSYPVLGAGGSAGVIILV